MIEKIGVIGMATTSRTSLPKPIKLKVCSVNEEYEIEDNEELLREAYESIMGMLLNSCCRGYQMCEIHDKNCIVLKAEKWLKDNN